MLSFAKIERNLTATRSSDFEKVRYCSLSGNVFPIRARPPKPSRAARRLGARRPFPLHWWLGKFVRIRKIPHQPHFALGGLASATRGVVGDAPHAALAASRGSPTRP